MKGCVLIIFMVIQTITCDKAISKLRKKLMVPKMDEKCKKIKCLTVEDPQCVRMTRHDMDFTFHIIAANKCELDYWKCHDDVEGKIVPMKYCGDSAGLTTKKNKKNGKAHIRAKRRAIHSKSSILPILREADKKETRTSTSSPQSTQMQFGRYNHPIKDPWNTAVWSKVPRDLLIYLIM